MRKYLIAAAVTGGLVLFGAGPAQADERPLPVVDQVGGMLDPAAGGAKPSVGGLNPLGDGMTLDNPLGEAPIVDFKPGTNSVTPPKLPGGAAPATSTAKSTAKATEDKADGPNNGISTGVGGLPVVGDLMNGGGLPLLGGGGVGGGATGGERPVATQESRLLGSDLPLLGGLLPEKPARTLPAAVGDDPADVSGLPQGGTDVPAATKPATKPADDTPPATKPGSDTPAPAAQGPGDDQQRLAEEPIDNESERPFSDGRPVTGEDPDFK
ncbi:hypothetical protein [Actinoplanes sp. NPDC089786]|uniref:hypothetical protein n=1 Tax=Actinoplanes sp. NPDC089786 TaxID=3155185 RepID=UPI0034162CEC